MEDLHHHPAEELQLHPLSPLCWNQHHSLNGAEFVASSGDAHLLDPSFTSNMVQDPELHWTGHGHYLAQQQLHLPKIKHEEQALLHDLNSYHLLPPLANGSLVFDPLSSGMLLLPSAVNIRSSLMPLQTPSINGSPFLDDSINYGLQHHLQGSANARSCFTLHQMEMPPSVNGVAVNKRGSRSSGMDQLRALKKTRFEHGPSLSPFKVRKEKLGDRIAALQQLVAPFGKTDTASVLMEAIGYIKFLQEQVETLSVPYMGPSNNKKLHTKEKISSDEAKPDLRTRGLCLVPLSCTSYVTNDHAVWSPPNFN